MTTSAKERRQQPKDEAAVEEDEDLAEAVEDAAVAERRDTGSTENAGGLGHGVTKLDRTPLKQRPR